MTSAPYSKGLRGCLCQRRPCNRDAATAMVGKSLSRCEASFKANGEYCKVIAFDRVAFRHPRAGSA